jgi:tRNA (guanine26-N2/guanine27-N2)-dimethyltransferase
MSQEDKNWLHILEDGTKAVREGSAEILFNSEVFYNPIQEFNRDLSVAAIKTFIQIASTEKAAKQKLNPTYVTPTALIGSLDTTLSSNQQKKQAQKLEQIQQLQQKYAKKQLDVTSAVLENIQFTILEALSASGLRSIRYAKEIQKIKQITSNDLLKEAADQIQINAIHNKVQNIIKPNHANATHLLYQTIASNLNFDIIDLDPYGSAAPFLDGAIQAVGDGGILCVTCTDMAVLAGGQPEACWAKYGGINIPNTPFTHEMALRILLHSIQSTAAKYKRAIEPMLSLSIDYYVRVFVRVRCNATLAKEASSKSSMLYYCQCCKSYETQTIGKFIKTEKGSKFGPSSLTVNSQCQVCDNICHIAGPFYSAPIHEKQFVESMLGEVSINYSKYGTYERMLGMLVMVLEELPLPFYYVLPRMCGILHCQTPSLSTFM